jgi:predicted ester cyclase/quinol monooxygenase YgiN
MYGTIAKIKTHPNKVDELQALVNSMAAAPGELVRYVYQMDANPGELWLMAVFVNRDAYWKNADSPEQHQRYLKMRALLNGEPEWHDGEIIDAVFSSENASIVRRNFDELINQEKKSVIAEIYAPNVLIHDPIMGTVQGCEAFDNLLGMFDTAFPHHRVTVDEIVSQGDLVCVLHTHTGTHNGPFMGMSATGKTVVVNGLELFRLHDGKIVEFWRKDDDVSLMMQLGMLPPP